ncbi:MAG TPA: 5-oxoprolinase subunit PxpA [Candidatus Marinimicrobia bacterium]|nr:5-oxoprolinase subunit PxpA [Candidatus Neomarinimicrobiota bacterium]
MDINCDMGEIPRLLKNNVYSDLMDHVTSISLACGGHAGDTEMMRELVIIAKKKNVKVGAHPSYPDRENFGRLELDMESEELLSSICSQVYSLLKIAEEENISVSHIKPHGALYNQAAKDAQVARVIGDAVDRIDPHLNIMCLSGSLMVRVVEDMGLKVVQEAFADRTYERNGSLRNRNLDHALITSPQKAADQARLIIERNKVIAFDGSEVSIEAQTICIHSDTPNAVAIAEEVSTSIR